ncbi:MAG: glycosyltransferase family 1 protein [Cyanobacteriota bacterium]|nr:glycosyltransferase family 1 protein [Cyanobacteriota bacterium]
MLHFFWNGYIPSQRSYSVYEYSNTEIAKWAEYYLGQRIPFHQSLMAAGRVTVHPDDILLGHPSWDNRSIQEQQEMGSLLYDWVRDNALSSEAVCHPNTFILMPWVPQFPAEWLDRMPHLEAQLRVAKKIFALCGSIWIERTFSARDDSIQYEVRNKLVRCHMGCAAQNFAIVKEKFNPIGERQILHVSNLSSYKGFPITCESLIGLDTLLHVASSMPKGAQGLVEYRSEIGSLWFNFLGSIKNSDPEFNHWVAQTCDFYIHTATMDAQATTILENCARGLVPLVTPESGFSSDYAIYLTHDPEKNKSIIQQALDMPENELRERSIFVRKQIVEEHNWQKIYQQIGDEILC